MPRNIGNKRIGEWGEGDRERERRRKVERENKNENHLLLIMAFVNGAVAAATVPTSRGLNSKSYFFIFFDFLINKILCHLKRRLNRNCQSKWESTTNWNELNVSASRRGFSESHSLFKFEYCSGWRFSFLSVSLTPSCQLWQPTDCYYCSPKAFDAYSINNSSSSKPFNSILPSIQSNQFEPWTLDSHPNDDCN